jgi:hypothetical protein
MTFLSSCVRACSSAVADVRGVGRVAAQRQRRAGRAHAVLRLVVGRRRVDAAVGLLDRALERLGRPLRRVVVEACDHLGGHLARDLARGVPAHAVGDDDERPLRREFRRV